jgi:hypothetical protein
MSREFELHPLCTLFPRITGAEFETLKTDIAENGLRQPIVIHQGFILDGGNRYRACIETGTPFETVEFSGDNLASFVISANLHRRHLTPGQQAAIVASAQDWSKAQTVGKPKSGNVTGLETVAARSAASGASDKTQRMADAVAKKSPELAKQVAHGEISLPKAHEQIATKKPLVAAPAPVEPEPEYENFGPSEDEVQASIRAEAEQLEYIKNLLASEDDPLAKALADVKMYREQVRVAKEVAVGLQNEKNQLIRTVKSLQAKLKKLECTA